MVIADWSLQPAFTLPRGELHNVGNYFAAKWALPFYRAALALFAWYGEATTFGLSFALDDDLLALGRRRAAPPSTSSTRHPQRAERRQLRPHRRPLPRPARSLLASLQITDIDDYFIHLNIYPHAFTPRGPAVGFWSVVDKRGRVAAGVSISRLLGMGAGWAGF